MIYNLETLGFAENEIAQWVYEGVEKMIELDKILVALEEKGIVEWITNETTLPLHIVGGLEKGTEWGDYSRSPVYP